MKALRKFNTVAIWGLVVLMAYTAIRNFEGSKAVEAGYSSAAWIVNVAMAACFVWWNRAREKRTDEDRLRTVLDLVILLTIFFIWFTAKYGSASGSLGVLAGFALLLSILGLIAVIVLVIVRSVSLRKAKRSKKKASHIDEVYDEDPVEYVDPLPDVPHYMPQISSPASRHSSSEVSIECHNLTVRTRIDKLFPIVVLDVETTGFIPDKDEIIEFSAVKYSSGFVPTEVLSMLTKPSMPIPASASAVNHITDRMVKDQPGFCEIADSVSRFLEGCTIIGHNLPFDLRFLFCSGVTFSPDTKIYDTLQLAKRTLTCPKSTFWNDETKTREYVEDPDVENYKLGTLCDYYGIRMEMAHRALHDVVATGQLFERLFDDYKERKEKGAI